MSDSIRLPASVEPAPLPGDVSSHRLRRALLKLGALIVFGVVAITLLPGLGELRRQFEHAQAIWIVAACALELLSTLSYVPAFRGVFCRRMSWGTSYKIAMSELFADSVLPVGGVGGLALGAWALRRGGMPTADIARKSVAFFLLSSVPNVGTLVLVGIGLATRVLPGRASVALTVVPAVIAIVAVAATLGLGRLSRRLEARLGNRPGGSRLARLAPALRALANGVDEAKRLLRHGSLLLWLGLLGYMVFDILALWASFQAVNSSPQLTIVWIAYLIGELGNLVPIPGGIGGVELGLIGALVVYGVPAVTATAAVLLYRVVQLWIPVLPGSIAVVQLRAMVRKETFALHMCQPGETVEIIGLGPVIPRSLAPDSVSKLPTN